MLWSSSSVSKTELRFISKDILCRFMDPKLKESYFLLSDISDLISVFTTSIRLAVTKGGAEDKIFLMFYDPIETIALLPQRAHRVRLVFFLPYNFIKQSSIYNV